MRRWWLSTMALRTARTENRTTLLVGVYSGQVTESNEKKRRTTTMASSSLRLSPSASHYVWRRNILAPSSRRTILSSIRFQSTNVSQGAENTLPWSEYLAIRRGKRKWEMVSSIIRSYARDVTRILFLFQALTIPCVLAGLAGGAAYFGSMELDATKPIMVREFLFI
jgi:hypothetical protein